MTDNSSVNFDIVSQNVSIIDKIKQKYKINKETDPNNIKIYILKYISEYIFDKYIESKIVLKHKNLYIFGNYITNKQNIIKHILSNKNNKSIFKQLICCLFNNINKSYEITIAQNIINDNNNEILKMHKKINKLDIKKKEMSEFLDNSNSQDMETSYKQSRMEIEMTNEEFKLGFEKDNTGLDFAVNLQQDAVEIQSILSLILDRNKQIDTINSNILKDRHHIDNLDMQIKNQEMKQANQKKEREQLQQTNDLQNKILQETINLKHEINQSFVRMINSMREDNQSIINTISETSSLTREQIAKASQSIQEGIIDTSRQMRSTIQTQSSAIIQQISKNAEEMRQQLIHINSLLQEGNRLKLLMLDKLKQIYDTIEQLNVRVVNAEQKADQAISIAQAYRYGRSW